MVEISASILSIKNENAIQTLYNLETSGIDYFHIDVMDGEFVSDNTTSKMLEYCEYINSISNLPLDVHLMVNDIKSYINSFSVFEPNMITFHIEATKNEKEVLDLINYLKQNNIKVGISIKPNTKIESIIKYLPYIHTALVMTVEPGKGGQELIPTTIEKVKQLYKYIKENNLEVDIEVDGGINIENISLLKQAGANIVVCGTSIVSSKDFKETVTKLKQM